MTSMELRRLREVRQVHTPPRTNSGTTPPYWRPEDALGVHFPELDTGINLTKERSDHPQEDIIPDTHTSY